MKPHAATFLLAIGCHGSVPPKATETGIAPDDTGYRDTDGDGFPDVADCGPADALRFPGAPERCNRIDDDCDGDVDESAVDAILVYEDQDGDGFGARAQEACGVTEGFSSVDGDCDDADPDRNPAAVEQCWSGQDDDCDGASGRCGPGGATTPLGATARWTGAAPGVALGHALAIVPGPSGTPYVAVGAPGHAANSGGLVLLQPASTPAGTVAVDHVFSGLDAGGSALSVFQDIDGDGWSDLIVGAPGGADGAGSVYLLALSSASESTVAATISGVDVGGAAGYSVGAGNTDDDAWMDVAIGVPFDPHPYLGGSVALLRGPLVGDLSLSAAAARVWGPEPGARAGASVALDGDANGDGFDDLVIGAPLADAGAVVILFGPVAGDHTFADADLVYRTDGVAYGLGAGVAWVGDTDADGYEDLAVSAPIGTLDGSVLLFSGTDIATASGTLTGSALSAAILGTRYAAGAVGRIGDVNGDGVDDIFAGGPSVFWGPISGARDASEADFLVTPGLVEDRRDNPGWLPANVPRGAIADGDGDGMGDVFLGGPALAPNGWTQAGEVQFFSTRGW